MSVCVSPIRYLPSATRIIGNWSEHVHSLSMARTLAQTSITTSRLLGRQSYFLSTDACDPVHSVAAAALIHALLRSAVIGFRVECFIDWRHARRRVVNTETEARLFMSARAPAWSTPLISAVCP